MSKHNHHCGCTHSPEQHGRGNWITAGKKYPCQECDCADYDRHFDSFPTKCPDCDQPWVSMGLTMHTCVGYFSEPGHDHDDNCTSRPVRCANGHIHRVSMRRSCPNDTCDWVGDATCWCDEFAKVAAWPALPEDNQLM